MQLVQTRFLVRRFGDAFDFYRDIFGLAPQRGQRDGLYEKFSFPRGDAAIALQVPSAELPLLEHDRAVVAVRVDDLDRTVALLTGRGAVLAAPPAVRFGTLNCAYVRDPEGNLIELQKW